MCNGWVVCEINAQSSLCSFCVWKIQWSELQIHTLCHPPACHRDFEIHTLCPLSFTCATLSLPHLYFLAQHPPFLYNNSMTCLNSHCAATILLIPSEFFLKAASIYMFFVYVPAKRNVQTSFTSVSTKTKFIYILKIFFHYSFSCLIGNIWIDLDCVHT